MTLKDKYINEMTKSLLNDLVNVVSECYEEHEYTDRTHNLSDAYGGALFYNGKNVGSFYFNKIANKPKTFEGKEIEGNKAILEYIKNYKQKTNGFEMIVLNAFIPYYGGIVEYTYGYKVIAMSVDKLKMISSKYKNSIVTEIKV